mmetsp:Transcript_7647/g.15861  ORF Transcript_7647/g.15861 Transcript_7647/m.15861 type:complete len:141 (-) Transcript_7647:23-445(-)
MSHIPEGTSEPVMQLSSPKSLAHQGQSIPATHFSHDTTVLPPQEAASDEQAPFASLQNGGMQLQRHSFSFQRPLAQPTDGGPLQLDAVERAVTAIIRWVKAIARRPEEGRMKDRRGIAVMVVFPKRECFVIIFLLPFVLF